MSTKPIDGQLSFTWTCRKDGHDVSGWDVAEYAAHAKSHGARQINPTVKPIRLRRKAPAARRQTPNVPPFKRVTWTEQHYNGPAHHGPADYVTEHRGQFWANGAGQYEVIVIEDRRSAGLPNRLISLYLDGFGGLSTDYSKAKSDRLRSHEADSEAITTCIRYHIDRGFGQTA
jgi:hypothetical protein